MTRCWFVCAIVFGILLSANIRSVQAAPTEQTEAGLAVELQQAVGALPMVKAVTGLRVVSSADDHWVIQIQADIMPTSDATITVDTIGRTVLRTVGNDRFQLILILAIDGANPETFTWSDQTHVWSRVSEQPTSTPTTAPQLYSTNPTPYYVIRPAHFRACPRSDCQIYATLQTMNTTVTVVGYIHGDMLYGSDVWYAVQYTNTSGYVHSSLISEQPYIPPVPTAAPYTVDPSTGLGIVCNDGTISYASRAQGACSDHGGIFFDPSDYSTYDYSGSGYSGGTVVCADGWVSHSAGKRGACSSHGGE